MVKQFIKELWHNLCSFRNSLGLWFSAGATILFWLLPTLNLGSKVNDIVATISLPYRLLILLGGIFVSVIFTSYSMYKKREQIISDLQNEMAKSQKDQNEKGNIGGFAGLIKAEKGKITISDCKSDVRFIAKSDIKQEIRNFLESIDPTILQRIDAKEKEIFISTNSYQSNKLMQLSEHSDFDEFLSFEKEKSGVIFSSRQGTITGYHLYPKDALIK